MGKQIVEEGQNPKTKAHRLDNAPEISDSDKNTWPAVLSVSLRTQWSTSATSPTASRNNNSPPTSASTETSSESKSPVRRRQLDQRDTPSSNSGILRWLLW